MSRPKFGPTFDPMGHETPDADLDALRWLGRASRSKGLDFGRCVEVGSWAGLTALTLAQVLDQVYCVDTWQGTPSDRTGVIANSYVGEDPVFRTFCRNMGGRLFREVIPCRGTSRQWAKVWPFQVDLVFIDADHAYDAVKEDIQLWTPHVRKGGILCGHDYHLFEGVKRAVDELIPAGRLNLIGDQIWYCRVH